MAEEGELRSGREAGKRSLYPMMPKVFLILEATSHQDLAVLTRMTILVLIVTFGEE